MLRVVTATRLEFEPFLRQSQLGPSLLKMAAYQNVQSNLGFNNRVGLPVHYNAALDKAEDEDIIVFTHDDVAIDDWMLVRRLEDAVQQFDVVGVAGNIRRLPRQPAWAAIDTELHWDDLANLSGSAAHPHEGQILPAVYGPSPLEVKLLDGMFLAARVRVLRAAGVRFDPQFAFHFYDMDFCRSCEKAGLRMGTWPIAVSHVSNGVFGTPEWQAAYELYLQKWGE